MKLKEDARRVGDYVSGALGLLGKLIGASDMINAGKLLLDLRSVWEAFSRSLLPKAPGDPFPKNFWSQLSWLRRNALFLLLVFAPEQGDVLTEARRLAESVGIKWGFWSAKAPPPKS